MILGECKINHYRWFQWNLLRNINQFERRENEQHNKLVFGVKHSHSLTRVRRNKQLQLNNLILTFIYNWHRFSSIHADATKVLWYMIYGSLKIVIKFRVHNFKTVLSVKTILSVITQSGFKKFPTLGNMLTVPAVKSIELRLANCQKHILWKTTISTVWKLSELSLQLPEKGWSSYNWMNDQNSAINEAVLTRSDNFVYV